MPGPKKTPTLVLRNRGSWRAKVRKDVKVSGVPEKPKGLDRIASSYWDKTVVDLEEMGILSSIDWSKLEILARMWSYIKAKEKDADGLNKAYYSLIKLYEKYYKFASEFCIGPANRAGMGGLQKKTKKDEKSRFFEKNA